MNIPFLGILFKRLEEREVDTQIIIVAKARVLRSAAEDVAESIRRRLAFERSLSRVNDLTLTSDKPWAVRLATLQNRERAYVIADTFEDDGYATRVSRWDTPDQPYWDVYLVDYPSFEAASDASYQARQADWEGEVVVVPTVNEVAPRR
jgi:hypothetical protein